MHEEFGPQGYSVTHKEAGYCMFRFIAIFSAEAAAILPQIGKESTFVNTKSIDVLGVDYRPTKESLTEMVNCMIEEGWVQDKRPK